MARASRAVARRRVALCRAASRRRRRSPPGDARPSTRGAARDATRGARDGRAYFFRARRRARNRARDVAAVARGADRIRRRSAPQSRARDWIGFARGVPSRAMSTSPRGASQRAETSGGARRRAIADATTTRGRRIGTIRRGRAI